MREKVEPMKCYVVMVHCLMDDVIVGVYIDAGKAIARKREVIEDPSKAVDGNTAQCHDAPEVLNVSVYEVLEEEVKLFGSRENVEEESP